MEIMKEQELKELITDLRYTLADGDANSMEEICSKLQQQLSLLYAEREMYKALWEYVKVMRFHARTTATMNGGYNKEIQSVFDKMTALESTQTETKK